MAAITSVNVAQAIPKLISQRVVQPLQGNLIMGGLVNRDFEPELGKQGDVISVDLPPTMRANNIAEGGSVQTQNPSLGSAQIALNMHAEATFVIPDVTRALLAAENGDFSLIDKWMGPAIIALAERVETDLLALYTNLTVNPDVGASATPLNEDTVDDAERILFSAKVPPAMQRYLVVDANGYSDLRQIPRFTENDKNGDGSAIASGTVGTLKSFKVYRSQYVIASGGTTYNLGFVPDALALVMRRLPQPIPGTGAIAEYAEHAGYGMRVTMSYAPNTLSQQFTVDMLYGVAVFRHLFGVRVLS